MIVQSLLIFSWQELEAYSLRSSEGKKDSNRRFLFTVLTTAGSARTVHKNMSPKVLEITKEEFDAITRGDIIQRYDPIFASLLQTVKIPYAGYVCCIKVVTRQ